MFKPMTAEQVLKAIYEAHADAFSDSRRLSALFADYSGGRLKAQQNQLDIFLKCDGNTCILNLRKEPKQKQQTEYHRLIQEMVSNYGMQEDVALEISGAFWRVVVDTEPPVSKSSPEPKQQPVTSTPAAAPQIYASQEVSRDYTAKTAEAEQIHEHKAQASVQATTVSPAMEQGNGMGKRIAWRFRQMTIFERVTFLIGLFGVSVVGVHIAICVFALLDGSFDSYVHGANKEQVYILLVYFLAILSGVISLWKAGFDFQGLLGSMPSVLSALLWGFPGLFIYWSGGLLPFVVSPSGMVPEAWIRIYGLGAQACMVFGIIWWSRRCLALRRMNIEKRQRKRQTR